MKPEGLIHLPFIFVAKPLETQKPIPISLNVDAMVGPFVKSLIALRRIRHV
jgi:hypothetical protein